ncbi:MAG: signal peptidase II [Clostridia bacterium]|nr:signal peptidase II [Clostridia bacterium]
MKNKKFLSPLIAAIIFVFVLALDLLTKGLIIPNLIPQVGNSVEVMPGFINFIYVENKGAAWGIFSNNTVFLAILSAIVLVLFAVFYFLRVRMVKEKSSIWLAVSFGLIAGGCLGNLIDRIAFGFVRDFINFQFMNFPVFNFADVALTVGVVTIIIYFLFFYSKEGGDKKNKKDDKND